MFRQHHYQVLFNLKTAKNICRLAEWNGTTYSFKLDNADRFWSQSYSFWHVFGSH